MTLEEAVIACLCPQLSMNEARSRAHAYAERAHHLEAQRPARSALSDGSRYVPRIGAYRLPSGPRVSTCECGEPVYPEDETINGLCLACGFTADAGEPDTGPIAGLPGIDHEDFENFAVGGTD